MLNKYTLSNIVLNVAAAALQQQNIFTLKVPSNIFSRWYSVVFWVFFFYIFFRERRSWYFMWDNWHEMSRLTGIFFEKWRKNQNIVCYSCDWHLYGWKKIKHTTKKWQSKVWVTMQKQFLMSMWKLKDEFSPHICKVWSGSSLFVYRINRHYSTEWKTEKTLLKLYRCIIFILIMELTIPRLSSFCHLMKTQTVCSDQQMWLNSLLLNVCHTPGQFHLI